MKIKKIICISFTIVLLGYLSQKQIYCFETTKKIIFRSSVEIGPDGQSYTLPNRKGLPGETLQMGYKDQMRWAEMRQFNPKTTPFAIAEPFLRTRGECPSDTLFVPILPADFVIDRMYCGQTDNNPYYDPDSNTTTVSVPCTDEVLHTPGSRGYCIVTDNGKWGPDENGTGIVSDWVSEPESSFYCIEKHQAYNVPSTFFWLRVYPQLDTDYEEAEKEFERHITYEDWKDIDAFAQGIKLKLLSTTIIDTFFAMEKQQDLYDNGETYVMTGYPLTKAYFMITSRSYYDTDTMIYFDLMYDNSYAYYVNYEYYYDADNYDRVESKCKIIHSTAMEPYHPPKQYEPTKFIMDRFDSCVRAGYCEDSESVYFGWASAHVICFR